MMRTVARVLPLLGLLVLLVAATGCPLAHEAPQPTRCFDDIDCFQAAGEYCDKEGTEGVCRVRDAGLPVPEPGPDMPKPPDKGIPDVDDLGPGPDGDLGSTTDGDLGPTTDGDVGPGPDSGGNNG